jgi:hypothetical protein
MSAWQDLANIFEKIRQGRWIFLNLARFLRALSLTLIVIFFGSADPEQGGIVS